MVWGDAGDEPDPHPHPEVYSSRAIASGSTSKNSGPPDLGDALLPHGAGGVALALRYHETNMQRAEHRSDAPFILVFFAPSFPWLET